MSVLLPVVFVAVCSNFIIQNEPQAAAANPDSIYPGVPVFGHESDAPWLGVKALATSNLMWAKDIVSTGSLLERWSATLGADESFQ